MGILKVKDEHRGKGYGSLVTVALAEEMLDLGLTPFAYVEEKNENAIKLFTSIGFKKSFMASWVIYNPNWIKYMIWIVYCHNLIWA